MCLCLWPHCQPTGTVLCHEGCKLHATVATSSHPFLLRVFLPILILNFENLESARVVPQFRLDARLHIQLTVAFSACIAIVRSISIIMLCGMQCSIQLKDYVMAWSVDMGFIQPSVSGLSVIDLGLDKSRIHFQP